MNDLEIIETNVEGVDLLTVLVSVVYLQDKYRIKFQLLPRLPPSDECPWVEDCLNFHRTLRTEKKITKNLRRVKLSKETVN